MTFAPLARFITASGLTNLGDGIATIAWAWTASLMTRDPLLIAVVPVALRLPWAIFAVPAGIVTDRVDRRKLILLMDLVRALAFAAAGLAIWSSLPFPSPPEAGVATTLGFVALVAAALTVGAAEVFRDNAAQTMLPALVPHERLEAANGRLWSVELTSNALVGPPLGATILVGMGLSLPFAANAVLYAIAAVMIASMIGRFQPQRETRQSWRTELAEGIVFLRHAPLLRTLAWLTGWWNLFFQMVVIALVLHVQENLGLSSVSYGLVLAAGAVGGIIGGLCGEAVVRAIGPVRAAQWSLLASLPCIAAVAFARDAVSLGVVLALFEFAGLVWNTVSVSTRQRMIPDRLLGRVNSVYRLLAWGMMPLGLLLSGLIVRISGSVMTRDAALTAPFFVAAMGIGIVAIAGWRPLRNGLSQTPPDSH
ncbi:MFS transporter [Rhizobium deserti]|uniref:MFS transporter n=1 Tax=Rhizobium deserti TaxID=2547961 RepID=A0A4R5UIM3_9HYPH|nr:MFS transporter [Rhizobium deserti]TDK36672.1 MFS transporter [Rhizobium deserti]